MLTWKQKIKPMKNVGFILFKDQATGYKIKTKK